MAKKKQPQKAKTQPGKSQEQPKKRKKKFTIAPPTPNLKPTGRPLDAKAAAKRLNISRTTLYSICDKLLLTHFVNGNHFDFYEVHLEDYLQRCRRG